MSNNPEDKNQCGTDTNPSTESGAAPPGKRFWVMRHKGLTGVALLLVAILIHDLAARRDRPEDNPQSQKKLLVRGSFPYDRGWELRIETSYYTRNPACRTTAKAFFLFPQAEVTRQAWRSIPVVREGGNRYRFEFFDDAILPGACDWQLKFVNYVITQYGKEIQGGAILGFPGRFNVIRYGCANVRGEMQRFACLQDEKRRSDPTRTSYQIDFDWEETK